MLVCYMLVDISCCYCCAFFPFFFRFRKTTLYPSIHLFSLRKVHTNNSISLPSLKFILSQMNRIIQMFPITLRIFTARERQIRNIESLSLIPMKNALVNLGGIGYQNQVSGRGFLGRCAAETFIRTHALRATYVTVRRRASWERS